MILESIIDIPRKTYAKGVFDNADTENPKLKAGVIALIKKEIKKFEDKAPVLKYSLIGSILTKRYRDDADLDINVLFDVEPSYREIMRKELASSLRSINGKLIPGTKHPINYFVITDPAVKKKNDKMADGVFDIDANKFERKPAPDTFDPKKYEADFQKKVAEIDVIRGELQRDIVDYKELKQLTKDDVDGIVKLVKDKLEEITDSITTLVDIGDEVVKQRQSAFANDMTPDEIRMYGKKHKLPKNVIYKMLEKYHYSKLHGKLTKALEDGKITDAEIRGISEAKGKTIVFTFGRFNPPTIGHEKLIDRLKRVSANDMRVYISKSNDPKKNPLNPRQKLDYMRKIFPRYARNIFIPRTNVVIDIVTDLYKEGFSNLIMVVGSDRVAEFKKMLTTYNDVKSRHGYYNFDSIDVISAGERDPDAEGASGMSASKMRAAAQNNDLKSFEKGLPNFRGVDKLFRDVRRGMNLAASYTTGMGHMNYRPIASLEQFEKKQIRDMYIREMMFNIGDIVENVAKNVQGKVIRRSTNYIVLEDLNNNLHKAWIWDCIPVPPDREVEVREHNLNIDYGFTPVGEKIMNEDLDAQPQDKDVKKVKGTQPKKYYKDLKKGTKDKRAKFFKSRKPYSKSDDDDDYKAAPGDKDAKTKPSTFTKKYKQMYGENTMDEACWDGYKAVGMKNKGGKQVPNCVPESMSIDDAKRIEGYVPESYEEGEDYANHTKEVTPGEKADKKPMDSKKRTPENRVTAEDIEKWASEGDTIDKYKGRYSESWKEKLEEVKQKMLDKLNEEL
jgi:hypothetical protein